MLSRVFKQRYVRAFSAWMVCLLHYVIMQTGKGSSVFLISGVFSIKSYLR